MKSLLGILAILLLISFFCFLMEQREIDKYLKEYEKVYGKQEAYLKRLEVNAGLCSSRKKNSVSTVVIK